jgi:hypothetical protein
MKETYVFRVILDLKEDVFGDIEIAANQTLEDFHSAILHAFGIDAGEMASFYASDEDWTQGHEVPLMDMGDAPNVLTMNQVTIGDCVNEHGKRLLYLYDFMNLWTFFCEILTKNIVEDDADLPKTIYFYGTVPKQAPEKYFGNDDETQKGAFDDAFDFEEDDEDDEFEGDTESNDYQQW